MKMKSWFGTETLYNEVTNPEYRKAIANTRAHTLGTSEDIVGMARNNPTWCTDCDSMEDDTIEHCFKDCEHESYQALRHQSGNLNIEQMTSSTQSDSLQDLKQNLLNWLQVAPLLTEIQKNRL